MTPIDTKRVRIPDDLNHRMRIVAAYEELTVQALLAVILTEWLARYDAGHQ